MTFEEYCKKHAAGPFPQPYHIRRDLDADVPDWKLKIGDPSVWSAIDKYVWSGMAEFALEEHGVALAERWIANPNPILRNAADTWLLTEWQVVWPALSDVAKRRVAEVQHEHLVTAKARADVLDEIVHLLRDITKL